MDTSQETHDQDSRNGIEESSQNVLEVPVESNPSATPAGKIKVHNEQGSYLMDATK